ncbi:unnamed protein product [Malus baccata var. baccata]
MESIESASLSGCRTHIYPLIGRDWTEQLAPTGVATNGRPGLHTALPQCPLPPPFMSPGLSTSSVFITAGKNPPPILSHIKHPNQNNQHQKCQCWVPEEGEDEDSRDLTLRPHFLLVYTYIYTHIQ